MMKPSNKHLAAPPVAQHHLYAPLYQAVIFRAMQDLAQKEHRDEAREWLLSPESDYAFATAGISRNSMYIDEEKRARPRTKDDQQCVFDALQVAPSLHVQMEAAHPETEAPCPKG